MNAPYVLESNWNQCDLVFLGIPYEAGISFRAGCRDAPKEIRRVAFTSPPTGAEYINLAQPEQVVKASDFIIGDAGDVTVVANEPSQTITNIEQSVASIRTASFPLCIGGDHSITVPAAAGCFRGLGADLHSVGLISFDADLDVETGIGGLDGLWHGATIRQLVETRVVLPERILIIGCRGVVPKRDYDWAISKGINLITLADIRTLGSSAATEKMRKSSLVDAKYIYLSFDVDCMEPALCRGTGWLSWNGLSSDELFGLIAGIDWKKVVGLDIVELSPSLDNSGLTTLFTYELLWRIIRFHLGDSSFSKARLQ